MDKYEQEIFNFLTHRENFEAMLKVNSHFSMTKEKLLQDFWLKVALLLETKIKDISNIWRVFDPLNKERGDAKLIIYKETWISSEPHPFVGVAWEHLFTNSYYGVWSNMNSSAIDSQKLKLALDGIRNQLGFRADPNWWPLWQHGKYNFSIDSNIAYILPDRVDVIVDEYADNVLKLLPLVEDAIDISL